MIQPLAAAVSAALALQAAGAAMPPPAPATAADPAISHPASLGPEQMPGKPGWKPPVLEIAPDQVPTNLLLVPKGTPVRLMVVKEVRTDKAAAGELFPLRVDEALTADGVQLVPVGAKAYGQLTALKGTNGVGTKGGISAKLVAIELPGGGSMELTGERSTKGGSAGGETALMIASLGPLGLFAPGKMARLKGGEIFTGFTERDELFDRATGRHLVPVEAEAALKRANTASCQ